MDGGFNSAWVTSPTGLLTEFKNDNYGTPVAVIDDPKDSSKPKAETDLVWDAADNLRSEETPNQVKIDQDNAAKGLPVTPHEYDYVYDAVGNMTKATDPLGRTTSMNYYLNRLSKVTEADGSVVQNTWDPENLNLDSSTDETLNSQAYTYDSNGNTTVESNVLGIADNRILNSDFEQLSGTQPVNWTAGSPAGTLINRVEYQSNAPYNDIGGGSNVLHINPGTASHASQYSDYINLTSNGKDYFTISCFMKTGQTGTSGGACVDVLWYDSNKVQIGTAITLFNVRNTTWQRYVETIQSPAGAAYAQIHPVTYGSYDGYFDNIQFEKSDLARGYNFVENSCFGRASTQWSPSDSNSSVINDPNSYFGPNYDDAKISLSAVGTSYLQSSTVIPANPGQYYTMLGFIKTIGISSASGGGGARLHVYFYDASGHYVNDHYTKNVGATTDWTKYVLQFTAPSNSATMKVRAEVANSSGTAYFDNIRLSYGKLATSDAYDSNDNYLTSTTDQNSNTTTYTNDAYGQNLSVIAPSGENTQYTYDEQERLRTVTDNAGNTTTYSLDGNGNILSTSMNNTNDKMSFTYDRDGHMISVTDADNYTTNLSYDEDGRIINQSNANDSSVNSSYDGYGNLSQVVLSSGTTYNYNYDLEGHTTNASMTNGSSFTYGYDAVGNLISMLEKDASGNTVTTINAPSSGSMYSSKDQILGYNFTYKGYTSNPIAFNYSYNPAGLINSTTGAGQSFSFNYDESSNPVSRVNPNKTTDNFIYNGANQTTGIQTVDGGGNTIISNNYTYDKDGKITNAIGVLNGSSESASYVYNNGTEKLNRLTQATINDGANQYTFKYTYDAMGNILSIVEDTPTFVSCLGSFTYDADNRITNNGFAYDKDGNLTSAVINGVPYQYTYDAEDRLITVSKNGIEIASYTYDAEGNRATKTLYNSDGTVLNITTYHYYNGELLYETLSTDTANIIHALYIRTPAGALEAVSPNYDVTSSSHTFYYYHFNAHGDVIALTDANGKVFRQYTYDPYGNIISAKDGSGSAIDINNDTSFDDSYLYAGYRYDKESGLYFLNARYYAPGLGRFLTKDSVVDVSNTKSLNSYVYVQDDPVNLADPDGNTPVMTDDAGHYVYSNGTTYTNQPEAERAQSDSLYLENKIEIADAKKKNRDAQKKATYISSHPYKKAEKLGEKSKIALAFSRAELDCWVFALGTIASDNPFVGLGITIGVDVIDVADNGHLSEDIILSRYVAGGASIQSIGLYFQKWDLDIRDSLNESTRYYFDPTSYHCSHGNII